MIFLYIVCILLGTAMLVILATTIYLFCYACVRNDKINEDSNLARMKKGPLSHFAPIIEDGLNSFRAAEKQDVYISSRDGLTLHAFLFLHENPKGTIILVHGWRGRASYDFSGAWRDYYAMGYNLLAIEQRAHGKSEGNYICFGVKERFDLIDWTKFINQRFGEDTPVIYSGISMGSSTVMMALGNEELPKNVCGAIADCGFTSAWDEFSYLLKHSYHLPQFPFLYVAELYAKIFCNISFRECNTKETLTKTKVPVLFIHGEADTFVPLAHTLQNNEICASVHEIVTIKNAQHGLSYLVDKATIKGKLENFLNSVTYTK